MTEVYKRLKVISPEGNSFTDAEPFNLMFKVEIGPSGG